MPPSHSHFSAVRAWIWMKLGPTCSPWSVVSISGLAVDRERFLGKRRPKQCRLPWPMLGHGWGHSKEAISPTTHWIGTRVGAKRSSRQDASIGAFQFRFRLFPALFMPSYASLPLWQCDSGVPLGFGQGVRAQMLGRCHGMIGGGWVGIKEGVCQVWGPKAQNTHARLGKVELCTSWESRFATPSTSPTHLTLSSPSRANLVVGAILDPWECQGTIVEGLGLGA